MTEDMAQGMRASLVEQARIQCQARRDRVLAHPDIAAKLTKPPLNYSKPEIWNGYIPPATTGALVGARTNSSVVRKALIAICNEVVEREQSPDAPRQQVHPDELPGSITRAQLTKLQILLKECGLDDRADRLSYCLATTDHEVESTRELSKRDAMRVIDALERLKPEIQGGP